MASADVINLDISPANSIHLNIRPADSPSLEVAAVNALTKILPGMLGGVASAAGAVLSAHIQRKTALMVQERIDARARIEGELNRAAALDQFRERLSQDWEMLRYKSQQEQEMFLLRSEYEIRLHAHLAEQQLLIVSPERPFCWPDPDLYTHDLRGLPTIVVYGKAGVDRLDIWTGGCHLIADTDSDPDVGGIPPPWHVLTFYYRDWQEQDLFDQTSLVSSFHEKLHNN